MSMQTLCVDIQHFWVSGTGRGSGALLDATAHRDANGLPVVPGRHLKGLLRDAIEAAQEWNWPGYEGMAAALFGDRTEGVPRGTVPRRGALRVGDARLPDAVIALLTNGAAAKRKDGLFRVLSSTRIDGRSGTAMDQTLRSMEVVVPLQLYSTVETVAGIEAPQDWPRLIRAVLPLISAVGAHRSRGLGRAVLSLQTAQ